MKKVIILGLIFATSVMMAACSGKGDKKDTEPEKVEDSAAESVKVEESSTEEEVEDDTENVDGVSSLCTDDKSISISILRPEGFEDSEYSSEHQVAFQRMGDDGTSSTQLNLRLMSEDENTVMITAQQEVEYLLSANADGEGNVSEVQSQDAGDRHWSYFTYSLDGTEGYRLWTSLSNGCVLSCTAENLGNGLEPLTVDYVLQILGGTIQE